MAELPKVEQPEVIAYEEHETKTLRQLSELYAMTNERQDNDPLELQEKLTLYGHIHEIMGDLEALAVGQEKLAYAYRQEMAARKFMSSKQLDLDKSGKPTKLTGDERRAVSELAVVRYRRNEARFAQESKKWKNRRDSVLEQINIMKRRQDLFTDQWNKANFTNGYS